MKNDTLNISRKTLYGAVIILILAILVLAYVFVFLPKNSKKIEIQNYKKALFESALCQYSCPLEEQEFQNKTQLLPSRECTKGCVEELRAKNIDGNKFSNEELLEDKFIGEIGKVIKKCKDNNTENESVINEEFFSCTSVNLDSLKKKFSYLS